MSISIHVHGLTVHFLNVVFPSVVKPSWRELIEVKQWEGFYNNSISHFIAFHDPVLCDNFADLLLNKEMFVRATRRNNAGFPGNPGFVNAVLQDWHHSVEPPPVPCTWKDLIKCMKDAGLNPNLVKVIEDNVL